MTIIQSQRWIRSHYVQNNKCQSLAMSGPWNEFKKTNLLSESQRQFTSWDLDFVFFESVSIKLTIPSNPLK
jgi:hypothetical protein